MKKTITIILIILCVLSIGTIYAAGVNNTDEVKKDNLVDIKDEMEIKKEIYSNKYGSDAYCLAGYIIEEIVQPYSIPLCFVGIAIGLMFQYAMGTRRLDYKHRGFGMVIAFVTILIICQILPFIYALVLTGWRG